MFLDNPSVMRAFKAFEDGFNIIVQGAAGYGKSTFLQSLIKEYCKDFEFFVSAPTGISAYPIGGITIHSLFGFDIKPFPFFQNGKKLPDAHPMRNSSKKVVLVIDEISMVRVDVLNRIDKTLRMTFKPFEPFGGIQIVIMGDIAQLPPIVSSDNDFERVAIESYNSRYFFDCPNLDESRFELIEFTKNYRQSGDQTFLNILSRMRMGETTFDDIKLLNRRVKKREPSQVTICTTNKIVKSINDFELDRIKNPETVSIAEITGKFPAGSKITPEEFIFKVGSRVMFTRNQYTPEPSKNEEGTYLNGQLGWITEYDSENHIISIVKDDGGSTVKVARFKFEYQEMAPNEDGTEEWKTVGTMKQFPLTLAWAISIHKSQGQTYDNVHINLGWGSFESGQTYVALSRCRSLEGLTFETPIKMKDIKIDKKVIDYLQKFKENASNSSVST